MVDKYRGVYCPHIEALLPKSPRVSVKARNTGYIDNLKPQKEVQIEEAPAVDVEKRLKQFGLSEYEIELVALRFLEGLPMPEITLKQGWLNVNSATHYLRLTLAKLRERKFRL